MAVAQLKGSGMKARVLVADDHPVVRAGLIALISQQSDLELAAEAENGEQAVLLYRQHQPDVALMDLRMPVLNGVDAIRTITGEFPQARILALSTYEGDGDIRRALEAGRGGDPHKGMVVAGRFRPHRPGGRGGGGGPAGGPAPVANP